MGLETGTYPSFIGGVSQQDDTVRNTSQVEAAENAWLHAALGAGKRPAANFVKVLASDLDRYSHFHSIVRDDVEEYIVAIGHRSIRVFDHLTGYEYTVKVTDPENLDYLNAEGLQPWTVFKTMTLADTTYVVNRNVTVAMDADKSSGYVSGSAQTIGDLPGSDEGDPTVPYGNIYHITGTAESPFDDFYVQKQSGYVWVECAKPNIIHKFSRDTMPHVLKRIADPVHADGFFFSFGAPEWEVRQSGDENSNPEPSFIGKRIAEVFLHRNRVGFMSTENVVMTEVNAPFNLWRTSVTQLLDSDPIDIAVPTNGVATLHHAVPFQSAVYIAGHGKQHLLSAEPFMSPKHVKTDPVTSYSSSPYIRPQLMGESLYFVDDGGEHAAAREYFMDDRSVTGDAAEVTSHVPRYLPGRVRCMTPVTSADCVLFGMESGDIYAYFVRWAGNEKTQSAWARWTLSGVGKVLHMHSIGASVYIAAEAPGGGVEMLRVDLMLNHKDADASKDYRYLLDRLAVVAPLYFEFGNYTDLTVPYVIESLDGVTALKTDDWADPGSYFDLRDATLVNGGQTIRIPGRHDTGRVVVGLDYTHKLTLTKPVMRDRSGNAIVVGRTQVRDLDVAYKDAAYFEVEVESKGTGRSETYLASHSGAYTARVMDDAAFHLSAPVFHSGSRRFPILSNADHVRMSLVNRLPFQCWFQSAQWRALFVSRSRV